MDKVKNSKLEKMWMETEYFVQNELLGFKTYKTY